MFSWLNKQGVKSSNGFIVQNTSRFTTEYQEGLRKIIIALESGILPNGKFCEIVQADNFSKWGDGTPISNEKQLEIIKNFTEAMEFQGIGVIVR